MSKISLNLVGVIIIGLIVWWFWRSRRHDLAQ
jgi:plastocyanin domain-containing protein